MRTGFALLAILAVVIATASNARAAVTFERLLAENGQSFLVIRGQFELSDSPVALANAVASSGARVVTFNSGGGNVRAAMAFGRAIRLLGLATVQVRATECASACALAFVGGVSRSAEPGSIGVHQSSFSGDAALDGHEAVAAVQAMTAEIMMYLNEMGVDPQLLQLSLSIPSSDIRYLTAAEMAQFRVTTSAPSITSQGAPTAETRTPAVPSASAGSGPESRALAFIGEYHEAWSRVNSQAIAFMRTAYADRVNFYGKGMSRDDVLKEKAVFAERWPQRAYSVKHGSERVVCGSTCMISGVVEWFAHSPQRAKSSSGSADFSLVWDPTTNQILGEAGRVISTDKKAKDPSRIIAQWQDQNGECRGGLGNSDETLRACDRREAIGAKLEAVGWCYGREGEYGYQMNWHVCGR